MRRDWSSVGDNTHPLLSIPTYSLDICRRSAGEEAIVLRCFSLWQDLINMMSPAKFRKDKEIIAEYETQVKGKWNMSHSSTATIVFLLARLQCVCRSTSGANAVAYAEKTVIYLTLWGNDANVALLHMWQCVQTEWWMCDRSVSQSPVWEAILSIDTNSNRLTWFLLFKTELMCYLCDVCAVFVSLSQLV